MYTWAAESGSAPLPPHGPATRLLNKSDINEACTTALKGQLSEAINTMTEANSHAIANYRHMAQIPGDIINSLRSENPNSMARIADIQEAVREVLLSTGTIIKVPDSTTEIDNVPTKWIKEWFDASLQPLVEMLHQNTETITHTLPHASESGDRLTPPALSELLHRVQDSMSTMAILMNDATYVTQLLKRDLENNPASVNPGVSTRVFDTIDLIDTTLRRLEEAATTGEADTLREQLSGVITQFDDLKERIILDIKGTSSYSSSNSTQTATTVTHETGASSAAGTTTPFNLNCNDSPNTRTATNDGTNAETSHNNTDATISRSNAPAQSKLENAALGHLLNSQNTPLTPGPNSYDLSQDSEDDKNDEATINGTPYQALLKTPIGSHTAAPRDPTPLPARQVTNPKPSRLILPPNAETLSNHATSAKSALKQDRVYSKHELAPHYLELLNLGNIDLFTHTYPQPRRQQHHIVKRAFSTLQ